MSGIGTKAIFLDCNSLLEGEKELNLFVCWHENSIVSDIVT